MAGVTVGQPALKAVNGATSTSGPSNSSIAIISWMETDC
jgi:hypothetical protein